MTTRNIECKGKKAKKGHEQFAQEYKDLKLRFLDGQDIFSTSSSNFDVAIIKSYVDEVHLLQIIDAGSGCGRVSLDAYAKRGADLVLLDIIPEAIELARLVYAQEQSARNTQFVIGDISQLPFKNESFDVVQSPGVVEHFRDTSVPIREYWRILRNDGVMLISVPNTFSWFSFYSKVIYPLYCLITNRKEELAQHIEKTFSARGLRSTLNDSNFEVVDLIPIMLFTSLLPLRRIPVLANLVFGKREILRPVFRMFYRLAQLVPNIAFGFGFLYAVARKSGSDRWQRLSMERRSRLFRELLEIDLAYLRSYQLLRQW